MFSRAHLRYSEKPEVNAFLAQFTTRCYNSLLVNEFWRSGPGSGAHALFGGTGIGYGTSRPLLTDARAAIEGRYCDGLCHVGQFVPGISDSVSRALLTK